MRSTAENQIKILSKKIVHSYACENRLDYLFSLSASDVYYLGAGRNMQAEGKKKFQYFLTKASVNLRPSVILNEKYLTKRLGSEHWMCEAICDVDMEEKGIKKNECLHATFLFRRNKIAGPADCEWELIHLHTSITADWVPPEEMLAIQQANKHRKNRDLYKNLTEREITLIRMLRNGMPIRDIAGSLGLAEITVKKALAKLYARYNVRGRSRLCTYFDAKENGYIEDL